MNNRFQEIYIFYCWALFMGALTVCLLLEDFLAILIGNLIGLNGYSDITHESKFKIMINLVAYALFIAVSYIVFRVIIKNIIFKKHCDAELS